ncbi:NAD-dependent epimerase/dehydratase family protein, partial [Immundisolibacter sp.]|uniref:NAD-dependent epimerase/dehydratase family protein n=1 Tax=Immundisolibacter sp. TaxID=1934948 RepID=UPI003A5B9529
MMKILVTGGTGLVGGGLLRRLGGDGGRAVVATVRSRGVVLPPGVETARVADLGPDTDWSPALAGVDAVVHCAARAHVMNERASDPLAVFRRVNVQGALRLAEQAAAADVRRLVFLSSIKVNGESTPSGQSFRADDRPAPQDAYGISKHEAEDGLMTLARATGMQLVIIRPPLVYGPGVKGNFA